MSVSPASLSQITPSEIVASFRDGFLILGEELDVEFVNDRFIELFQLGREDVLGQPLRDIAGGALNIEELIGPLARVLKHHERVETLELERDFSKLGHRVLRFDAHKTVRPGNGSRRILLTVRDVSDIALAAKDLEAQRRLAQGMIDTVRSPLLVLDTELRIVAASQSFFSVFQETPDETIGRRLWDLGNGQWASPELVHQLTNIIPLNNTLSDYEVRHHFPKIGDRAILLNARGIVQENGKVDTLLLAMEDVTQRRAAEGSQQAALMGSQRLLEELNHRVMNTLTTISALITLESRALEDAAGQQAFKRMSERISTVGALYRNLMQTDSVDSVEAADYLETIARDALRSIGALKDRIELATELAPLVLTTRTAVPLGLIVNELVTNSIKYAFPDRDKGVIGVNLEEADNSAQLTVWDDGVGIDPTAEIRSGRGQRLIEIFVQQVGGKIERDSSSNGTRHSIRFPLAAAPVSA